MTRLHFATNYVNLFRRLGSINHRRCDITVPTLVAEQQLIISKIYVRNWPCHNPFKPVVTNLFLTVAHFYFESFPWPYSQSIAQELDPNFHQSWIRMKQFFRPKTGILKKKKRSPPEFKRFFRPKTGDLQKKKTANTSFSNQNALWPTSKCFCGPPVGHGPQVESHCFKHCCLYSQFFRQKFIYQIIFSNVLCSFGVKYLIFFYAGLIVVYKNVCTVNLIS